MNIKYSLAIRSIGWSVIWLTMFPELFRFGLWHDNQEQISSLLMQYLISGLILEASYRWIVSKGWLQQQKVAADSPSLNSKHNWIELAFRHPEHSGEVNVLCADGKQRTGRVTERDDGRRGIVLNLTSEEAKFNEYQLWNLRPTHWREADNEEKQ